MKRLSKAKLINILAIFALIITSLSLGLLINITTSDSGQQDVSVSDELHTGFYTSQGNIYKNGDFVNLNGVVWTGFNTEAKVVHGLWARNWKDIIIQLKTEIGANAVKIPICAEVLNSVSVASIDYDLNSDLEDLNSLEILDLVANELQNQNIYFVISLDKIDPSCTKSPDLWYSDEYSNEDFLKDLKFISRRYNSSEYFVGIELLGSLGNQATWGAGNSATDWNLELEKIIPEIVEANPNILLLIPGLERKPNCSVDNKDLDISFISQVKCDKLRVDLRYQSKVIFAPSVKLENQDFNPDNTDDEFDWQFNYFVESNESFIPSSWNSVDSSDVQNLEYENEITEYLTKNKICSSFYFALNPSAGESLGLLNSDWKTFNTLRVGNLKNYWGNCKQEIPDVSVSDDSFCRVDYTVTKEWDNNFIAEVKLTNLSVSPITDWELNWQFPDSQSITNFYNSDILQTESAVSVIGLESNRTIPAGDYISFGFVGTFKEQNQLIGDGFRLNGELCQ
jgi:endoglucanase